MKKSIIAITLIISIVAGGIAMIPVLPWVYIAVMSNIVDFQNRTKLPDLQPEIKYGEFPFRVEIEHNGERIIREDTIICEYEGSEYISGVGRRIRRWKVNFISGSYDSLLVRIDDTVEVRYRPGTVYYLMGDTNARGPITDVRPPRISVWWHPDLGFTSEQQALDHFGITIISIEETPPIVNTFR